VSKDRGEGRPASEELLLRAAWFYYKDELTQDEIAKRLSVSRASVGRMLDRARKVGLVSINLNADHLDAFEVSRQLRHTFGLSEALVVPDHVSGEGERSALNARLGLGGAQFMSTHLRPGGTLGVGWGRHVAGDILGQFFDASGQVVKLPIHDRRIGIELSDLAQIPKVVGVAGGVHKVEAILGALRGGFLDVLVTNELAALRLLELEHASA